MAKIGILLGLCGLIMGATVATVSSPRADSRTVIHASSEAAQPDAEKVACQTCAAEEKAAEDKEVIDPCQTGICPIYKCMQHGTDYCTWYALRCQGTGVSPQACSYAGACNLSSAINACSENCQNCTDARFKDTDEDRRKKHDADKDWKKGGLKRTAKKDAKLLNGAVAVNPNGKSGVVVKFTDKTVNPNREIVAQIWKVAITSEATAFFGREIEPVTTLEAAKVLGNDGRLFTIEVAGFSEPFFVIADK